MLKNERGTVPVQIFSNAKFVLALTNYGISHQSKYRYTRRTKIQFTRCYVENMRKKTSTHEPHLNNVIFDVEKFHETGHAINQWRKTPKQHLTLLKIRRSHKKFQSNLDKRKKKIKIFKTRRKQFHVIAYTASTVTNWQNRQINRWPRSLLIKHTLLAGSSRCTTKVSREFIPSKMSIRWAPLRNVAYSEIFDKRSPPQIYRPLVVHMVTACASSLL